MISDARNREVALRFNHFLFFQHYVLKWNQNFKIILL